MRTEMTAQDLDKSYTAICNALNAVGETNAQQFLAMLSLSLIARTDNAADVLALIENVRNKSIQTNYKNTNNAKPAIAIPVIKTPKNT